MRSKDAGIARVILPSDVSRDSYIRRCYDTGRVSVYATGIGVLNQISIPKHIIGDIEFPESVTDAEGRILYGSKVTYIKIPNVEEYVIFGVLKDMDDVYGITEYQYSVGRSTNKGVSMISGDAEDGSLSITVNHNDNGGILSISVGNKNVKGQMTINISGVLNSTSDEVNITAYNKLAILIPKGDVGNITSIEYVKGDGFKYSDEFGNTIDITKDSHKFGHKKQVVFGDNKKSAMLYEDFEEFMTDFITEISKSTTATALGTMPLNNSPAIINFISRLKSAKIKSNYVKLK